MAVSAAAFSVQAAQVSLYGSVSTGVLYQNQASLSGGKEPQESKDSFTMESGFWGDSIWGITGEEDLGNGWTVGFTLENGFGSDTGEMEGAEDGVLFDSQAYLRIGNDKVNFAFGNIVPAATLICFALLTRWKPLSMWQVSALLHPRTTQAATWLFSK